MWVHSLYTVHNKSHTLAFSARHPRQTALEQSPDMKALKALLREAAVWQHGLDVDDGVITPEEEAALQRIGQKLMQRIKASNQLVTLAQQREATEFTANMAPTDKRLPKRGH